MKAHNLIKAPSSANGQSQAALISQISARLGVTQARVTTAFEATQKLSEEEFGLFRRFTELHSEGVSPDRLQEFSKNLQEVLENYVKAPEDDPLEAVDDELSPADSIQSLLESSQEARQTRARLLGESISAEEAERLTNRKRQNLERLRKANRALALRVRNQWRYPAWQFDTDQSGGIVAGLPEVMKNLGLSAFGTALWLTQPCSFRTASC